MVDVLLLGFLMSLCVMGAFTAVVVVGTFIVLTGIVIVKLALLSKPFCVIGALITITLLILIGLKIRRG